MPYPFANPALATYAIRVHAVWSLVWSNPPAGSFALTAVAQGRYLLNTINVTSAPVNITVLAVTNAPNPEDIVSIVAADPVAVAGTNMFWAWPGATNALPSWTNWPPPTWGYMTNWGPKPALFTVRRFGDASSNLTVNYRTSGTASNGVDYVALPGYVNIAAGAAYGLVPVVPIDHGSNNVIKTVVLTLAPATNTPAYLIGRPNWAEALIYYRWLRPTPIPFAGIPLAAAALADGSFHFNSSGPEGAWFAVQSSTDMGTWTSVSTNQVVQGSIDFMDPGASGATAGFYRVIQLPNPPAP